MGENFVHHLAEVDERAYLAEGCRVWALAQVRENAKLGENCIVGRGAYIGSGVELGANCKVQNGALLYEPAILGPGVFIGPGVIFTNDQFPRAVTFKGRQKRAVDWLAVGVTVGEGVSIGAGAICVAPVTIGDWALVGAGATVTTDVAPHSLVLGSPARHVGWVGRAGVPLLRNGDKFVCPKSGRVYSEHNGRLIESEIS